MLILSDSSLSPTEKDDRETTRLINKKPPPSRKRSERRGPKYDNRRKRIKEKDPDLQTKDKDLSLISSGPTTVGDIALQLFIHSSTIHQADDSTLLEEIDRNWDSDPKKQPATKFQVDKLKKNISTFADQISGTAYELSTPFKKFAKSNWLKPGKLNSSSIDHINSQLESYIKRLWPAQKHLGMNLAKSDESSIVRSIISAWPHNKDSDWFARAVVVGGLHVAIDRSPIPESFKAPFLRVNPGDVINDRKLIRNIIKSSDKDFADSAENNILQFAQLSSALHILGKNPSSVNESELTSNMRKFSKVIDQQASELLELGSIMHSWHDAISNFKQSESTDHEPGSKFDNVLHSLDQFFDPIRKPVVDPTISMEELQKHLEDQYGEIPGPARPIFEGILRAAASNRTIQFENMSSKLSTYHGVKGQGHPSGPTNTPYLSYDKRYFGKDNYDSIIKYANKILKDDWLKYSWDGGSEDAQYRAALDLAIHLADGNLYQSKIDAETYNMLLNKLAGWKHDSFTDTIFPPKTQNRSASDMNQSVENIARIASDLRLTNPKVALDILKNIRTLTSAEASGEPETSIQDHVSQVSPVAQQEQQSGSNDIEFRSMNDDDFKKLKEESKKLFDAKDIESFMKGLDGILDKSGVKTASNSIPIGVLIRLAHSNPEIRSALLPVIVAAKKGKSKPKKVSQVKKDEETQNSKPKSKAKEKSDKKPDSGKKVPPAKKPPVKGRKASIQIEQSDINW